MYADNISKANAANATKSDRQSQTGNGIVELPNVHRAIPLYYSPNLTLKNCLSVPAGGVTTASTLTALVVQR